MTQLKGRDWWTDGSVIPNQSNPVCHSFDLNPTPASGSAFLYPLCSTLHSPDNYMDIVDPVISVLSPGRDDKKCFQFIEQTLYGCAIKMTVASDKLQRYLHKHLQRTGTVCSPGWSVWFQPLRVQEMNSNLLNWKLHWCGCGGGCEWVVISNR